MFLVQGREVIASALDNFNISAVWFEKWLRCVCSGDDNINTPVFRDATEN